MPNVDYCVRMAEQGLCHNTHYFATEIAKIDNKFRVKIFKNKKIEDIETILIKCSNTIKTLIKNDYYNDVDIQINDIILEHSSNNNKEGADLIHKLQNDKNINIEVKFGNETSKNIGMEVFNKIFDCVCFQTALSIENRKIWRDLYFLDESEEQQLKRLEIVLNNAIEEFNKIQESKNFTLSKLQQEYMEKEILNNSGSGNTNDFYMKFILNGDDFSAFSKISTGLGIWMIHKVEYLSSKIKRVNVYLNNYTTNIQIKYVLNWKNNYHYNNKIASAKLGLGTPNWNVWVDVETSKICY